MSRAKLFAVLFPKSSPSLTADVGLLALRLVAGAAFIGHGWPKLQNPFGWMGPDSAMPGVLQALAALAEFGGGLLWIVGALTPLASLGILATMTVAVGLHLTNGDGFHIYQSALVFLAIALSLLFGGPGRLSIDAAVRRVAAPESGT